MSAALGGSSADEIELWASRRRAAITRYSHNSIHQNALSDETHVRARVVVGRAVGVTTTNGLDRDSIKRLIEDAASLARLQVPNEEWPGVAEPQPIAAQHSFDDTTAELDPRAQAEAVGLITQRAADQGIRTAGTHQLEIKEDAVVNTRGVALSGGSTLAYVRALAQGIHGSGYADDLSWKLTDLNPAEVAVRAIEKARRSGERRQLEPGVYEAVFEDLAVAEILRAMSIAGLDGEAFREGRSFMSERLGEQVTGANFTLHDDALDPRQLGIPFDLEGTPKRRVALIEAGVARGVLHDRKSGFAADSESTGHAGDYSRFPVGAQASNLVMAGGTATREELIASVSRGILITRFHYTNMPDPKSATMTGTTRDGTFLIEDGRITAALANVRYTMSSLELFAGIEFLGPQRLVRDWWSTNGMSALICLAPSMKVSRAVITGSSPL